MTVRRITLRQLFVKAGKNRALYFNLVRSPEKALKEGKLKLSPKDLRKLQRWLRKVHCMSGRKLAGLLMMRKPVIPWPE